MDVRYLKAGHLRFEFAPESLAFYSGALRIEGDGRGDERSLHLQDQACDDRRYLPPVEMIVPLSPESGAR